MEFVFLGTGAGNGVPEFYCNCEVCLEAAADPRCRRTRSSVAVIGREIILIDAPPELSSQLIRERINHIDCLFITHAHYDHCAGLGDLEIYTRFNRKDKLPVFMSADTLSQLKKKYESLEEWMDIRLLKPGDVTRRSEIDITAIDVVHSQGAVGFIISGTGHHVAYLPDTGPPTKQIRKILSGIETLVLDSTFWGENWYPDSHLTVDEAIDIGRSLDVRTLYLSHLSMHYGVPVTSREIENAIGKYGNRVMLAYDGTRFSFGRDGRYS